MHLIKLITNILASIYLAACVVFTVVVLRETNLESKRSEEEHKLKMASMEAGRFTAEEWEEIQEIVK